MNGDLLANELRMEKIRITFLTNSLGISSPFDSKGRERKDKELGLVIDSSQKEWERKFPVPIPLSVQGRMEGELSFFAFGELTAGGTDN